MICLVKDGRTRTFSEEPQINMGPAITRLKRAGWAVVPKHPPAPEPEKPKPQPAEPPKPEVEEPQVSLGSKSLAIKLLDRLSTVGGTIAQRNADLVRPAEAWKRCAGALDGHPAFVLGNGPTLQSELGCLEEFFTIGVNRILYRHDPTILMWFDADVADDIGKHLRTAKAVRFTNSEINGGQHNSLECIGRAAEPATHPLDNPAQIPVTGNSGVAAAYWAMSLGCTPIYLLGITGTYNNGATNFYGRNGHHKAGTRAHLLQSLKILLGYRNVFPILGEDNLRQLTTNLEPMARGRTWYLERFRRAM